MTVTEFKKLLDNYDHYYYFSDDHRVWERGRHTDAVIQAACDSSRELKEIYDAWIADFESDYMQVTSKSPEELAETDPKSLRAVAPQKVK